MWKNNIVGHTEEDPEQLLAHYANARTHDGQQRDAMRASLDRLGIIDSVKVNDRTGNVIDGHMRIEEYISKGIKKIPVEHVDLSEAEELEAIAYYDAVGTLAKYDPERLEDLLQQIDFDDEPLENLLTNLNPTGTFTSLDFSDIEGNQNRQGTKKPITVNCPNCDHTFQI